MILLTTLILLLSLAGPALASAPTTRPDVKLTDIAGAAADPLHPSGKANVIVFVRTDCPISNSYAPIINRLDKTYAARGVTFYLVYAIRDVKVAEVKQHLHDFKYTCDAIIDRKHALVHAVGAIATPEAFVIAKNGSTAYHGRIDDSFPSLGKQRPQPTTHELEDAINAVLAGKTPPVTYTRSVGCAITDD